MLKNIFILCTIRNATSEYIDMLDAYVDKLEQSGHTVYTPYRDTNQFAMAYDICKQNLNAITNSDEVHIFYNSKSQITHFYIGIAFTLKKKIVIVKNEPLTESKSFQRMLVEWRKSA